MELALAAQIGQVRDLARVLPQTNIETAAPNAGGLAFYFRLLGLHKADVGPVLIAVFFITLIVNKIARYVSEAALIRKLAFLLLFALAFTPLVFGLRGGASATVIAGTLLSALKRFCRQA